MKHDRGSPASLSELETYFSEDYLHFSDAVNPPEKSDREVAAIWELLSLGQGSSVLELGCGYGRITNRLAEKGARVTGLDISPVVLKKAEADAAQRKVRVDYILGDIRSIPWRERFDAAFLWYTTFGYFEEADNERVLNEAASSLRKGGRLLIDQLNRFALLRDKWPTYEVVQCNDDIRIDTIEYDALTDRRNSERIVVRNGSVRRTRLSVRHYGFSDYVRMLRNAGFETIEAYGQDGSEFTPYGPRLVVLASK
ncbi:MULTISPECIES: class I SAM-dependent methyltransferase [unclassified Mesorhizobium]|uniref:class I SAM-dependent methyltransferase n=1 Tax=unclassified Mesorhizobium TaxID=325217 RepID=UPI000519001C|nr:MULTISPECIES: class I SAM-dependent methyltransferase [unclassified Mesorhizobium]WJI80994.1 class I SAM-dependent methyltransferase [Mesorhizobium sp. C374B]WJI87534.1 class I SAM-dependent methyltransferase [Mesorhizobium sp. C372A]